MRKYKAAKHSVIRYGGDILSSPGMTLEKQFMQHGTISVYDHSVYVADMCLFFARLFHLKVDERTLVRGALLHDYFLYDWHVPSNTHKLHGFSHAKSALRNAERDFKLNQIERDMIERHMFPLNPVLPKYKESILLCAVDKFCACYETSMGMAKRSRLFT